jgi:thiol-disulfide isomerase/thioredoxin
LIATIKEISALIICLAFALPVYAQTNQTEQLPALALKDLKGKIVKLEDFKGKVILLNFWATWCPPCITEIPELIKWQKKYQSQGLQIIGITYPPTNRIKVRSFVRKSRINYPILFGSKKTKELFDSGDTMPFSVVIDKDGSIKERVEGIIFADEFNEKVKPLLEVKIAEQAAKFKSGNEFIN